MRNILLVIFFVLCIRQVPAWSGDIVVLQGGRLPAYNSVLQGFTEVIAQSIPAQGPKSIQAHTVTSHILSEAGSLTKLRRQLIRQHPDLILAIGSSSLSLVKGVTNIPIIYLMVPYPEIIVGNQTNITGINIHISAAQQLKALTSTIPGIQKIGLLYNPERTGSLVKEAEDYARQNQLSILALPVKTSREVPGRLAEMRDRIDCFWMLPDRLVITPQTIDYILLYSLENLIPILTFSEKYLEMGATLSVSFDLHDMGKQAGETGLQILKGIKVPELPPVGIRKMSIRINHGAAKMLRIEITEQGRND